MAPSMRHVYGVLHSARKEAGEAIGANNGIKGDRFQGPNTFRVASGGHGSISEHDGWSSPRSQVSLSPIHNLGAGSQPQELRCCLTWYTGRML